MREDKLKEVKFSKLLKEIEESANLVKNTIDKKKLFIITQNPDLIEKINKKLDTNYTIG